MIAPEITDAHRELARRMIAKANAGWYVGDEISLRRFAAVIEVPSATNPNELGVKMLFTKDKMHHSVGWWRNAEYEYCWHLSISAWDISEGGDLTDPEDVPEDEERYWAHALFPRDFNKLWHEPGGTDPRLTPPEKMKHRHFSHLRLFLDPETFEPFVPTGEVYDITRWIPGLTPDKVDR